jgi:hypothetical protein
MNRYRLLLRLYPRIWRARYEEEFLVVLSSHPFSVFEGIDIMRGALDAHLHPHLGTATMPSSERMRQMFSILRASLLTIFCAYVAVVLAGTGFQKMTESPDFQEVTQMNRVASVSFHLVIIGAVGALLALLVGGLPLALAVIRSARARKQRGPLFGLAVPILAFAALLGTLLLMKLLSQSGHVTLVTGLFYGAPIITAISSAISICVAVSQSEISEKFLRFALPASIYATISMALIAVSTLSWGLGLRESAPQFFAGNNGLTGLSTIGTWLGIVITMALATALAIFSLIRGLSARSALCNTVAE